MERSNGTIQWNIVFTRLIHDWEVEILASFYNCLYSYKLRGVGEDKLWWVPSSKGAFEVRSYYRVLVSHGPISFPWKSIWRTKAPPRVAFFAWTAARGKILTIDNLRRRGMIVINKCWLCESVGSRWIIYSFIAEWRMPCGMPFSAAWVIARLCLVRLGSCWHVGVRGVAQGVRSFGR
jgi:hypothetical protein